MFSILGFGLVPYSSEGGQQVLSPILNDDEIENSNSEEERRRERRREKKKVFK